MFNLRKCRKVESLDYTRTKYKMGIKSMTPWEIGLPDCSAVVPVDTLNSNSRIYLTGIYGKNRSIWTGRSMETLQARIRLKINIICTQEPPGCKNRKSSIHPSYRITLSNRTDRTDKQWTPWSDCSLRLSSLIRVFTICHSICFIYTLYCKENPNCST